MIVATVRALKMHGGGPDVVAGKPLDHVYKEEAVGLVEVRMKKRTPFVIANNATSSSWFLIPYVL